MLKDKIPLQWRRHSFSFSSFWIFAISENAFSNVCNFGINQNCAFAHNMCPTSMGLFVQNLWALYPWIPGSNKKIIFDDLKNWSKYMFLLLRAFPMEAWLHLEFPTLANCFYWAYTDRTNNGPQTSDEDKKKISAKNIVILKKNENWDYLCVFSEHCSSVHPAS